MLKNWKDAWKDFSVWDKILVIVVAVVLVGLIPISFKCLYEAWNDIKELLGDWAIALIILLILYNYQIAQPIFSKIGHKRRELVNILELSYQDSKKKLYCFDFISVPDIFSSVLSEVASTMVLVFVYIMLFCTLEKTGGEIDTATVSMLEIYSGFLFLVFYIQGTVFTIMYSYCKEVVVFCQSRRRKKIEKLLRAYKSIP